MRVSIFGLGRVGLPLAIYLAEKGMDVVGVDVDSERINKINEGQMPFIEEGAQELLKKHIGGNLRVTLDESFAIRETDYIILTLGTPIDRNLNPIVSQILNILEKCSKNLRRGQTIILRSTVYPGITEYIKGMIEKNTGMKIGEDIYLAFCPERIAEGKSLKELPEIPQIIGGFDSESCLKAKEFFSHVCDQSLLTTPKAAELAKLFCNMYRYINFAIANQFMILAEEEGENINEIITLVNQGYKRGGLKSPGFTAGPCLYKDGFFLAASHPYTELISTSWKINEGLPRYLIDNASKLKKLNGEKVVILGLGFKRDSDDTRNSLSFKAKRLFEVKGAEVLTHDPIIREEGLEAVLQGAGVVLIAINHSYYEKNLSIELLKKYVKKDCIIIDIWGIFKNNRIMFKVF